uniref:Uncharacterized protein n=1 Tax=Branchiostoma floridae TaxID=7739 RepID=Q8T745_BRAFL|nr:unknown [Branchiostoma floridae]
MYLALILMGNFHVKFSSVTLVQQTLSLLGDYNSCVQLTWTLESKLWASSVLKKLSFVVACTKSSKTRTKYLGHVTEIGCPCPTDTTKPLLILGFIRFCTISVTNKDEVLPVVARSSMHHFQYKTWQLPPYACTEMSDKCHRRPTRRQQFGWVPKVACLPFPHVAAGSILSHGKIEPTVTTEDGTQAKVKTSAYKCWKDQGLLATMDNKLDTSQKPPPIWPLNIGHTSVTYGPKDVFKWAERLCNGLRLSSGSSEGNFHGTSLAISPQTRNNAATRAQRITARTHRVQTEGNGREKDPSEGGHVGRSRPMLRQPEPKRAAVMSEFQQFVVLFWTSGAPPHLVPASVLPPGMHRAHQARHLQAYQDRKATGCTRGLLPMRKARVKCVIDQQEDVEGLYRLSQVISRWYPPKNEEFAE